MLILSSSKWKPTQSFHYTVSSSNYLILSWKFFPFLLVSIWNIANYYRSFSSVFFQPGRIDRNNTAKSVHCQQPAILWKAFDRSTRWHFDVFSYEKVLFEPKSLPVVYFNTARCRDIFSKTAPEHIRDILLFLSLKEGFEICESWFVWLTK